MDAEKEKPKTNWLRLALFVALGAVLISVLWPNPQYPGRARNQVSNSKQVVLALKIFAIDYDGAYPERGVPVTMTRSDGSKKTVVPGDFSNSYFDALVPEYMPSERIFGYRSHDETHIAPIEDENLGAGEAYFSYVTGLRDSSSGTYPLVFTPPANSSPPFRWNDPREAGVSGGTGLANGKHVYVVIAYNDGSAELRKLDREGYLRSDQPDPFALFDEPGAPPVEFVHPEPVAPSDER